MTPPEPPRRRTSLALRLLGVLAAAVLLLALVLAITRDRNPVSSPNAQGTTPPDAATSEPSGTAVEGAVASVDVAVLSSPEAAAAAGPSAVLAAGREASQVDWADLTDPAWSAAMQVERPVYVGRVQIGGDRDSVSADLVIAFRAEGEPVVGLRFLPGADVLADAGASAVASVEVDGVPVAHDIDSSAGLLTFASAVAAGDPMLVRIRLDYVVPDRGAIADDGGPAGFGLLARSPGVTMLGHGLPLLTFDDRPMVAWGDVGAFPAAVWSVQVHARGIVATGGVEGDCTPSVGADGEECVWARGTGLRDLAIAVFDADATVVTDGQFAVHGAASTPRASAQSLLDETAGSVDSVSTRLGPLPWHGLDVVLAPLTSAAGMEFPGLVVVDPEYLDRLGGGFGTFVVAHEVAHQWFHALVGNSSLADSVVDESLAQFASLWYFRDVHGAAAAQSVVDRYLAARYRDAREDGVREVAPASEIAAFGGNSSYGPMTYARAPFAWIVAEEALGEDVVAAFLAALVRAQGLGEVTSGDVRSAAAEAGLNELVAALDRWWFDPAPAVSWIP